MVKTPLSEGLQAEFFLSCVRQRAFPSDLEGKAIYCKRIPYRKGFFEAVSHLFQDSADFWL